MCIISINIILHFHQMAQLKNLSDILMMMGKYGGCLSNEVFKTSVVTNGL